MQRWKKIKNYKIETTASRFRLHLFASHDRAHVVQRSSASAKRLHLRRGIVARLSPYLDEGILRLRVTSRPSRRPRASAFIADFSERFPSAVSRRSRSRGPHDRRCRDAVAHHEGTDKSREAHGEPRRHGEECTGVCGSCESRARFVDARLTIARELHGWPCGCASRCIGCICRGSSSRNSFRPTGFNWYPV